MTDSKYFTTTKKGEIHELQEELVNPKEDKRKDAVKKVIAAMTVGKDVSMLFTDVLNCIQTNNLELKKLVYLYVINHAKMQPDRAILAVNTFQRDASDVNPLIRALAIRTMGCIRVDKVTEYLCEPLRNCLKDKDPYVRKTAALCVAKLYDMNAELVEGQGFLDLLTQLLSDSNPTVVANAVAALTEIEDMSGKPVLQINSSTLSKLQAALNECTEWGQVFILQSLSKYKPADAREAEAICERIVPRLNHANSAVVLSAVKVLMVYLDLIQNAETVKNFCKKMGPPLVTLLTTKEPEIQYVALRNINLIVQKRPSILAHEMRVFFIKYNDPIYVKMEKLEIMIMLASERNIEQVLNEFKEAASEVDVEFVRKAVRAIGRCAIKIEKGAEKCIQVLLDLIQTKVNYVVQEAIIVIKDIFRKYPNRYESIIATLCQNLDTLDEPEAKASMIWIIGEYAERIENANELLDSFLDNFQDESTQVQLQLVTAIVKLFLKRPKDTQEMVQKVLNLATQETDNPDLRDRGYVYWRLLSTDPEAAKAVVLGERPLISDTTTQLDDSLLNELLSHISTLASVYHKPPEAFVAKYKDARKDQKSKQDNFANQEDEDEDNDERIPSKPGNIFDLDTIDQSLPSTTPSNSNPTKPVNVLDELDFLSTPSSPSQTLPKEIVLPADRGNGMQISGSFVRRNGQIFLDLTFTNRSGTPLSDFAIQFQKNYFGLAPAQPQLPVIAPGQSADTAILIGTHPGMVNTTAVTSIVQVAVKNNTGVFYFAIQFPLYALFSEDGELNRDNYAQLWKSTAEEHSRDLGSLSTSDLEQIIKKLRNYNLFHTARRSVAPQEFLYFSAKANDAFFLVELQLGPNGNRLCVKTKNPELWPLFEQAISSILSR
mmetsp:Transcript_20385/g.28583  ORF Transcript_20385/g.28583 Transcript_20385/m.28583 type:complete len:886 (-) Transcript_20385:57-2714(-)